VRGDGEREKAFTLGGEGGRFGCTAGWSTLSSCVKGMWGGEGEVVPAAEGFGGGEREVYL